MRGRFAAWASILLLILLVSSCARNTPANTQSSGGQPTPDTSAQSAPAPAAGEKTAAPPPAATQQSKAPQATTPQGTTAQQAAPAPAPVAPPPPVVLPAGTVLTVRINDPVGSNSSKPGDKFTATVSKAVTNQGNVVIPVGSAVTGAVDQAEQGGKI